MANITPMNQPSLIDSKLSLDGKATVDDCPTMIKQPYQLYIERTDKARNMARFYAISIEPCLFGGATLHRRWGRIGTRGQSMVHHFDKETEAVGVFLDLVRRKRSRGYALHTCRQT